MKAKNFHRAAFFYLRALIASLLCLSAGVFTILAFGLAPQPNDKEKTTRQAFSSGAIKIDKYPAEPPPLSSRRTRPIKYSGPPQQLTPVSPVRTIKLRDMTPIDPD